MTAVQKLTRSFIIAALLAFAVVGIEPAQAAGSQSPTGFIYGTVETESGNEYTGVMRWGTQEAFWDDLFNGTKKDLPYADRQDRDSRQSRRGRIRTPFGTIRYNTGSVGRQFIARFGDIAELIPGRGDRVEVIMKGGHSVRLDGGSDDIGARITVDDASLGRVKLEWKKIERIRFASTPSDVDPGAHRLYGRLVADGATFEGYIQWDKQECTSADKLDGDTSDGDLSVEMGRIRSIEKRSQRSSEVILKDGRKLRLSGSNDVNSSNRGIYVEDKRWGRVTVAWEEFDRVEFMDHDSSGRTYGDYPSARPLRGVVTDYDDRSITGEIVFDLDETHDFELLNGERDGVEFNIPFRMIRSIEPGRRNGSKVVLKSGEVLQLEDSRDVAESNSGVLVLREGNGREAYVPWRDVNRVEFK